MPFVFKRERLSYWSLVSVRFYSERPVPWRVDREGKIFREEVIWRERHDLNCGNCWKVEPTAGVSESCLLLVFIEVGFGTADRALRVGVYHDAADVWRLSYHVRNTAR